MQLAPGAIWRPVHACTGRKVKPELGVVMHTQEGNNSPHGWFNRKDSRSSSTWWISKKGVLEQYVDIATEYAWAQGSGNAMYHSIEFEGWVREALTGAQLETAANLYAWGATERGWAMRLAESPGQQGFGWHGMGAKSGWGHPNCPGDIRRPQRALILARAAALLDPRRTVKTEPTTTEDDMTPAQEQMLKTLIEQNEVIIAQLGGNWKNGTWPGWPQLGNQTLVDAVAELLVIAGGLPDETATTLLSHEVGVRDPKTGAGARVQLLTALTRAAEAAEARQLLDGTVPPGVVKPTR